MPAGELVSRARVAFRDVREVVQALARGLARSRRWGDPDFRSVVAELRKEQLAGAEIVPYYRRCIRWLERVTEREGLMTARRAAVEIRLATEAGDDAIPVPHLWPRGPMGNGPRSELVLPVPGAANRDLADDFTFRASVWLLAAHEVHPGHALRIAAAAREGRSLARSLLGYSLAASEGWAVYVESEILPYLPVEVQLIILQAHLTRTARAFLDPGLHQGAVGRAEAVRFLREEVGHSPARARQEIERCTGWQPGGGLAYLCGQLRFAELRVEAELVLGRRFDRRWYHDLLLSQGFLPLSLLREVILAEAGARAAGKDRP
jgi:hypothetical protein